MGRRVGDVLHDNEEHLWRWSARAASIIPLAGLVFVLTVLGIKGLSCLIRGSLTGHVTAW